MAKKKGKQTLVNFILDETGSMSVCKEATISGFNEYVDSLEKTAKDTLFSLTKFNSSKVDVVHKNCTLDKVERLNNNNYEPNDMTPLYDAIGTTVMEVTRELKEKKSKPNVLCVIMTDGEENTSKEFTRQMITDLIKKKEKEGWTFIYLGANQDSWANAQKFGMSKGNTMDYDTNFTMETYVKLASATANYANVGKGQTANFFVENNMKEEVKDDE